MDWTALSRGKALHVEPILPGSAGDFLEGDGGACCDVGSQGFSWEEGLRVIQIRGAGGRGAGRWPRSVRLSAPLPRVRNWVPVHGSRVPRHGLTHTGVPTSRPHFGTQPVSGPLAAGALRLASCARAAAARCGQLLPSVGPRWQRSARSPPGSWLVGSLPR